MIASVAFACVGTDRITARGIELTPEMEACAHLMGVGALRPQPFDRRPIKERRASGYWVEQYLYLVDTSAPGIEFPPLTLKRENSLRGVLDVPVGFDCFGICFYELGWPRE